LTFRLVLAALVAASAVARADDEPASQEAPATPSALERGVALFERGEFASAARALEEARAADPSDTDAGLLLGIAYYRLDRYADAEPLLTAGAASEDAQTAASARIFLALIALERDDEARAHALLGRVAASATDLAPSARSLLDRSTRAPLSLFAMIRPEFDSNVPLLPSAPVAGMPGASQADADVLALATLGYRPIGGVPFQLESTVSYRLQAQLTDFSFLSGAAGAAYDDGALDAAGSGEIMALGGAFYAAGGGGRVGYRLQLDEAVAPFARYGLRYRDYRPPEYDGYTGFTHTGTVGVALGARRAAVTADVDYVILRELFADPGLVATGHAASAALRMHLASVSVVAAGTVTWRFFDEGRRDVQIALDASVALDLTSSFGLVAGSTFVRNASSLDDADYTKITAFAGVYFAAAP
jgi:hypothetical protein